MKITVKKRTLTILVVCVFALALGYGQSEITEIGHTLKFSEKMLKFSKIEGYDLIEVKDMKGILSGAPGEPWLPSCMAHILLPEGFRAIEVEAAVPAETPLEKAYQICPAQPPIRVSDPQPKRFVEPNAEAYGSNQPLPAGIAKLEGTYIVRGFHVAVVSVNPLSYIPATGEVYLRKTINLKLILEEDSPALTPMKYNRSESIFEEMIRMDVVNPEEIQNYSFAEPENDTLESGICGAGDRGTGQDVQYLLITTDYLMGAFQSLLNWKTKKGVPAEGVSVSFIQANYDGDDLQEKIRNCIRDYVQNKGVIWVALGGDSEAVPDRGCYGIVMDYEEFDIPTDLYYSELDSDWDSNQNGIYGEVEDNIDLGPDVFVGRLACAYNAEDQAAVISNKTVDYEKNFPASNFAEKLLLGGVRLVNPYDSEVKSELMYSMYVAPYWNGTKFRFYDTNTDFEGGAAYDVTVDHVNEQMINGYHFFHMCTHGLSDLWSMETGPAYRTSDASWVDSGNRYAQILTIACNTAGFDQPGRCLGEGFLHNPVGGAVSYIGCSRLNWDTMGGSHGTAFQYNDIFYRTLFQGTLYEYPQKVGAVYAKMKEYYMGSSSHDGTYRWVQFGLTLLGDPEVCLYTYDPSVFSPDYASQRHTGYQIFKLETGVQGALVCLSKGDEVYDYGYTDELGHFETFIDPQTIGLMDVTITAPNYLPHEGEVVIVDLNDECMTAMPLLNGSEELFGPDLSQASRSLEPWPICANPGGSAVDVWYKIYPGISRRVSLSMQASIPGGGFVAYSGTCGDLTLVNCAEADNLGMNFSLEFVSEIYEEKEYYIRLYGDPSMVGDLQVDWVQDHPGNVCSNALITECGTLYDVDNQIPGYGSDELPCLDPGLVHPMVGRWLEVTVPPLYKGILRIWDYDLMYMVGIGFYEACGDLSNPLDSTCGWEEAQLVYHNISQEPVVLYVLVNHCSYCIHPEIEFSCSELLFGEICSYPQMAGCGDVFDWSNRIPGKSDDTLVCMEEYTQAPVVGQWIEFTVPAETKAAVSVWDYDLQQYVGIGLFESCGDVSSPLDSVCDWEQASLTYYNPTVDEVTLKALINFCQWSTQPEISINCAALEPGEMCAYPKLTDCGVTYHPDNPIPGSCEDILPCIEGYPNPMLGRWMEITVPPDMSATVSIQDWDFMDMVGIGFYNGCGDLSSPIDSVCSLEQAEITYQNTTPVPKVFKVLINHNALCAHPMVQVNCSPLPYGESCELPKKVSCGDLYDLDNRIPGVGDDLLPCMEGLAQPIVGRWLEYTVPDYSIVTFEIYDYDLGYHVGIGIYDSCGAVSSPLDSICDIERAELSYWNNTESPVTLKILVNHCLHSMHPQISVTCRGAYGGSCDTAFPAFCGDFFDGNNPIPYAGEDMMPCMEGCPYPVVSRWLDLEIPAETRSTVTMTEAFLGHPIGMAFYDACGDLSSPLDMVCGSNEISLEYENTGTTMTLKVLLNHDYNVSHPLIGVDCVTGLSGESCEQGYPATCDDYFDQNNPISGVGTDKLPCMPDPGPWDGRWLDFTVPSYAIVTITVEDNDLFGYVGIGLYDACGDISSPFNMNCNENGTVTIHYVNMTIATEYLKILINSDPLAEHPVITVQCEYDA